MSYTKIAIKGNIEILSGLHIGASKEYSAIGSVDSPVVTDPLTRLPMIPASSIKGKIRTLLARKYTNNFDTSIENEPQSLKELFGYSNSKSSRVSKLIFRDCFMDYEELTRLRANGAEYPTEVKFENTINRLSGIANPRQIERVIRGAIFPIEIVYEMYSKDEAITDMKLLVEGLRLLENDYLGGSGSRGYGRIKINNLDFEILIGKDDEDLKNALGEIIK